MEHGQIIKAVKLDLDGKEVDLTIEQAKKLRAALNELFGEKVVKEVVHQYPYQLVPLDYGNTWPAPWWQTTWTSDGTGNAPFSTTSGVVATFDQQNNSGTLTLKVA